MTVLQRWSCGILGCSLVVSLVLSVWRRQDVPNEVEPSRFDLVRVAIRNQDFNAAQRLLGECRFDERVLPEELAQVAESFYLAGYVTAFEACLEAAVKHAGSTADEYHLRLGMQKFVTGRYWEAQRNWSYLLTHGGLDLISFPALGNRELTFGYEDASLERGLENDVDDALVYLGLGYRAFQEKDFVRGQELIARTLEIESDLIDAQLCWGEMLYEQGKVSERAVWMA
ncbi:MAG: hypothetical protein ACKVHE_33505, partial [Planctomycetales bacterium]